MKTLLSEFAHCNALFDRKKGKQNTVVRDYVLPDYTHIKRGFVRPEEETSGKPQGNEQVSGLNNFSLVAQWSIWYC